MPHAIPFTAFFGPSVDEHVEAQEIARRVGQHLPDAAVDWQRGRAEHLRQLEKLAAMGVPEMLLRREESDGHYVHLTIPLGEGFQLAGLAESMSRDLGDWMELEVEPYDTHRLIEGTKRFAEATQMMFDLQHKDKRFDERLEIVVAPMTCADPYAVTHDYFLKLHCVFPKPGPLQLTELPDWKKSLAGAIATLTSRDDYATSRGFQQFATADAYAESVILELEAIAPPVRCWKFDLQDVEMQNGMLLDQGEWTTAIEMNRTPKGLFV